MEANVNYMASESFLVPKLFVCVRLLCCHDVDEGNEDGTNISLANTQMKLQITNDWRKFGRE